MASILILQGESNSLLSRVLLLSKELRLNLYLMLNFSLFWKSLISLAGSRFISMKKASLSMPPRLGICLSVVASSFLLGAAISPAKAITPGIDNLSGGSNSANGSWTLGYEFSLSNTSIIDALGSYDQNGDGLNGTYNIGLWDTSGNLLRTASVSGSGNPLVSSFRWADIVDITLSPGNYIVASAGDWLPNGDDYYYNGTYTTAQGLTWVRNWEINGSNLQFPTSTYQLGFGIVGGNVSLNSAPPVPGPLPLLGASAAFGFSRQLRQRVKGASLR